MKDANPIPKKTKRRWLSFSLRGLLVFTILAAVTVALPLRWRQEDIAQYQVEQVVGRQIKGAKGWASHQRLPESKDVSWSDYPGHLWKQATNWGSDADLYEDIESVHLPTSKLDKLVPQLRKLRSLRSIDISPDEDDAYRQRLSNEVIEQLGEIDTLEDLDLSMVSVSPSQLRRLSQLPNLRELSLPQYEQATPILQELSHFPHLESLTLEEVPYSQRNMELLQAIPHLKKLTNTSIIVLSDEDGIAASDEGIDALGKMTQIEWLVIDVPVLDDRWYQCLGKMTSLTHLSIYGERELNEAPGAEFSHLASLTNLESLTIDGVRIDDQALETIGKLTSLTDLACDASLTTDAGMQHLAGLPKLKEANLSGTQITIHGLHALSTSRTLDYVHLGSGFHVSLRDHRGHTCGTCAFPSDYAEKTQFGPTDRWPSSIGVNANEPTSQPDEDPFAAADDPFAAPAELPDNFADPINDPFVPVDEDSTSQ